jgi:flagellar motor switch protein FliM
MSNVLSQEEIDALLGGLSGGKIKTAPEDARATPSGELASFDFTDQDRFFQSRLPTLETIHDRFARLLRLSLSTAMRRTVEIQIANQTICRFSDFSNSVEKPSSLHILHIEPLGGSGMLVLPGKLILTLVDLMFGGSGQPIEVSPERDFTMIETRVIEKITGEICRCYMESWASIHPLQIEIVGSETNMQFINIVQPGDPVNIVDCDVVIDGNRSSLSMCIPFATLEPVKEILKGSFMVDRKASGSHGGRIESANVLGAFVELQALLGHATITGRDLLRMKAGDVLQLDEDSEHPIKILVEGVPKLWGTVGAHKSNRALQVTGQVELMKGIAV